MIIHWLISKKCNFQKNLLSRQIVHSGESGIFRFYFLINSSITKKCFFSFLGFFLSRKLNKSDQTFEDLEVCEKNIPDKTPKVMINVIKESDNGKADLEAYSQKVIFELFPVIGSSVFQAGLALSDGWSQVGRIKTKNL